MGRPSFRNQIIASGMQTVHHRGFGTVGLRQITAEAGVAQGSFTNHFASKEEFGVAVLDHYFDQLSAVMTQTLEDESRKPTERLGAYFERITDLFASGGWRYGCLAGNMGLEAAEHSELLRQRLSEIFAEWAGHFAEVIRQAQKADEVRADLDSEQAGAALLEAWQGAMLRMKIERSPAPLDRFKRVTFSGSALSACAALTVFCATPRSTNRFVRAAREEQHDNFLRHYVASCECFGFNHGLS
jgi:TetR/AcrR family transcriptional regulator, transcriptional repressor for nem operon